ncbi:MAG: hypothetical protein M3Q58_08810 [Bacteroidota bacterium]|nr:hypothetical protein [Bacteroidota bacterium]
MYRFNKSDIKFFFSLYFPLMIVLFFMLSCKHKPVIDDLESEKELISLVYSPDSVFVSKGIIHKTTKPTVTGKMPITFNVYTQPSLIAGAVTIDSFGIITIDSTLMEGTYVANVIASNEDGSYSFNNALTIIVSNGPFAPSSLIYSPNGLGLVAGNSGSSSVPTVQGTTPITFTMISSPNTSEISIDTNLGIISASNALAVGSYSIDVIASNSAGTTTFTGVYTISVSSTAIAPSNLAYSPNALTIDQGNVGNSVIPTISGTTPITFTMNSSPVTGEISINSGTGQISVSNLAAAGTYDISVTATNSAGSTNFPSIYTVTVNVTTGLISFETDIKPIILNRCPSCHTGGTNTNYTIYANASANAGPLTSANTILERINRTQGAAGFMPQSGTKLPQAELDLIQQWYDDGLQP